MDAMWMWTTAIVAAVVVVTCLATGTAAMVMMVGRTAKPRTTGRRTGRSDDEGLLARELRSATAAGLPPQVPLQMIVDRLDGSRSPRAGARRERLIRSLASAEHVACELRDADATLGREAEELAKCRRLLANRGRQYYVSVAAQTDFAPRPPPPTVMRKVTVPATDHKHATVGHLMKRNAGFMSYFRWIKILIMVSVRFLNQSCLLHKVASTVDSWSKRLIRITTKVNKEEKTTTLEFEVIPRWLDDTTNTNNYQN